MGLAFGFFLRAADFRLFIGLVGRFCCLARIVFGKSGFGGCAAIIALFMMRAAIGGVKETKPAVVNGVFHNQHNIQTALVNETL